MRRNGAQLSKDEEERIIRRADTDCDGVLGYQDISFLLLPSKTEKKVKSNATRWIEGGEPLNLRVKTSPHKNDKSYETPTKVREPHFHHYQSA
jgi:hypothetical protein